jgi:hypothetical protein
LNRIRVNFSKLNPEFQILRKNTIILVFQEEKKGNTSAGKN